MFFINDASASSIPSRREKLEELLQVCGRASVDDTDDLALQYSYILNWIKEESKFNKRSGRKIFQA